MIVLLPYIHSIHKRQRRGLQFKITYVTVSKQSLGIAGERVHDDTQNLPGYWYQQKASYIILDMRKSTVGIFIRRNDIPSLNHHRIHKCHCLL